MRSNGLFAIALEWLFHVENCTFKAKNGPNWTVKLY